ncbi:CPXCG motif-containing cysteine-rich protein [Gammaproteobacteria bacterium]|nr:CPXCG motif-containing cysteine-rich protein [Gammaproteobacteria bacterium]MDB9861625.1 CPXCG motif-containing cysteine-rich protein [Gammaproteobacteria bacterium]
MSFELLEEKVTCPFCWERITLLIDLSESQIYTEDCFVCCRPILINAEIDGDHVQISVTQEDEGF